jgi:hypothetical protein
MVFLPLHLRPGARRAPGTSHAAASGGFLGSRPRGVRCAALRVCLRVLCPRKHTLCVWCVRAPSSVPVPCVLLKYASVDSRTLEVGLSSCAVDDVLLLYCVVALYRWCLCSYAWLALLPALLQCVFDDSMLLQVSPSGFWLLVKSSFSTSGCVHEPCRCAWVEWCWVVQLQGLRIV